MKLFQKLLLTPAVIGFLSPITASASETNLMDVSNYSQVDVQVTQDTFKPLSSQNPLLAGGEGLNHNHSNDYDADSFSATTTATFSSNWLFGATDRATNDKANFVHDYGIELTSTFNGSDALVVGFDSGSNAPQADFDVSNTQTSSGTTELKIDGMSYSRQLGDRVTVFIGGNGAPGSTLYTSACAYGGQTDVLEDCGIRTTNLDEELGASFGASFDLGYGVTAAVGYEGQGGASEKGLMTKEATDAFGAQVAYTGDNFGVAVAFASIENHDTDTATTNDIDNDRGVTTSSAFSAYYSPELQNFPSVSIGFESTHDDSAAANADKTSNYFVGLQWDDLGNGSLGASFGSKAPEPENDDSEKMYEVFYSYNYADGITITPLMFVKENAAANTNDETGIFLKTSFSF